MRLGIDFGTTRIIVAAVDRGNFPLLSFSTGDSTFDWFPSLIAIRGKERLYGWDAWEVQGDPSWTPIRSIKRFLENSGPHTVVDAGGEQIPLTELLAGLTGALHQAIQASTESGEPLQIMLGVPANANSNQRFLTADAFRRAGFEVLGLLNEPSAASIEFGHKQPPSTGVSNILVYDLGGGTFDASLVETRMFETPVEGGC